MFDAKSKLLRKDTRPLFKVGKIFRASENRVPLLVLINSGVSVVSVFFILGMASSLNQLANRPQPTFVELADGRTISVRQIGHYDRQPEVISRFVAETMTALMDWRGILAPSTVEEAKSPKADPGVSVGTSGRKVATKVYEAAFAIDEKFRAEFLDIISNLTPQDLFTPRATTGEANVAPTPNAQVLLVVKYMAPPIAVSPGRWKVRMVANLVFFRLSDKVGKAIAFNKEIYVQAIEPPLPEPNPTELQRILASARASGLEIYAIRDLVREDLQL